MDEYDAICGCLMRSPPDSDRELGGELERESEPESEPESDPDDDPPLEMVVVSPPKVDAAENPLFVPLA